MKKNIFRSVAVILVLILQGCGAPGAPGQDWDKPVRFPGNPWDTTLSDTGCPSIDGTYKDRKMLFFFQFPKPRNQNGMQVNIQELNEIPGQSIDVPRKPMEGQKITPGETINIFDTSAFYKEAVTSIHRQNNTMIIDLMDGKETIYRRTTINLVHPMIGCRDGAFVTRVTSAAGGAEGAYGPAYAVEFQFRKLPDGNLQIKIHKREWYFSIFRGLVGFGPDNRASGTEPRVTEKTLIFPAANISPQKK